MPNEPLISSQQKPGKKQQQTPDVDVMTEDETKEDTPWRVILYDDDVHTFDEVIRQLIKALNCNSEAAEKMTFRVHNEGKADVYEGSFEACFEVSSVLKEIQLVTDIKG